MQGKLNITSKSHTYKITVNQFMNR